MQSWLKRLVWVHKVAGVSIQVKEDDTVIYSYCLLEERKKKVTITACKEQVSLQEIQQLQTPISLIIDGKGILIKSLPWLSDSIVSLGDILPGADDTQFCIDSYQISGTAYTSIARRSLIEQLIQPLSACHLLAISLGPVQTMRIFDLLGQDETIFSSAGTITKVSGTWKISERQPPGISDYDCNGIIVQQPYLSCFSAGLAYLLFPDQPGSAVNIQHNRQRYYQEALLRQGAIGFGAVLFIALLINFVAFSIFSSYHEQLEEKAIALGGNYQKTDSLARELESKKDFLRRSGWMSSSEQSYYADQLAATRPDGLIWTQLNIHPRYKNDNETYAFQGKSIRIKGEVKNVFDLNAWQKKLGTISWIDKTELEYLKKNDETLYSDFSLLIAIK